jgi:hypothetical protein
VIGFAGSAYAKCLPEGQKTLSGNILLDFDKKDPLLMVGRMCLAVTITLAFPMLVIPARDIILRSIILPKLVAARSSTTRSSNATDVVQSGDSTTMEELQEPLLSDEDPQQQQQQQQQQSNNGQSHEASPTSDRQQDGDGGVNGVTVASAPVLLLLSTSVVIFWSAGALASTVSSIDVVWDLLGSSLSILLSYLIPAGTYLVITKGDDDERPYTRTRYLSRIVCWGLLAVFFPLMIISTANAIENTFF